jgi:hypothetical protein
MLYKVLKKLYPERMDLFVAAVRVALEKGQKDPTANKGAVFVRSVREFAEVAGVDLGLQSEPEKDPVTVTGQVIPIGTRVPIRMISFFRRLSTHLLKLRQSGLKPSLCCDIK